MIKILELEIEVEDINDFNDQASGTLDEFCLELMKSGNYASTDPDDIALAESEGWEFIWNTACAKKIEAERGRLYEIGERYFGDGLDVDLDISTHMYIEF